MLQDTYTLHSSFRELRSALHAHSRDRRVLPWLEAARGHLDEREIELVLDHVYACLLRGSWRRHCVHQMLLQHMERWGHPDAAQLLSKDDRAGRFIILEFEPYAFMPHDSSRDLSHLEAIVCGLPYALHADVVRAWRERFDV